MRVNVGEQATTFAVLAGSAVVAKEKGFSAPVRAGESLRVDVKDDSRYFLNADVAEESWDRWNEDRDAQAADDADARTSARDGFAGTQGYGWADLDANGSWYNLCRARGRSGSRMRRTTSLTSSIRMGMGPGRGGQ